MTLPQEIQTAHILVPAVRTGDATGDHALRLFRLLREHVPNVMIFCQLAPQGLPQDLARSVRHIHPGDYHATADLTIVEYPVWFGLAERVRRARGVVIFWYHGVTPPAFWGSKSGKDALEYSIVRADIARCAHLAAVDSPFGGQELAQNAGYPLEKIRVVPFGVDVTDLNQPPNATELTQLRQQWQLEEKRILIYIGRVAGNKRLDLHVEALSQLAADYPDLHLLIVGDNDSSPSARELTGDLKRQIDQLDLAKRVTWTGRVPAIAPYLHLADLYVQASQHEGFGVPLIEAMSAGLPIVASASGAMPWVLGAEAGEDAAAGLLFRPGDVADLVHQIRRVLDDADVAHRLRARGGERVQHFSGTVFAQEALRVIMEAASLWGSSPPAGPVTVARYGEYADIVPRDYQIRSNIPLIGGLVAWIRRNSTTHVKEAYLDRMMERQVRYNQLLADEVERLSAEVRDLRAQLEDNH